MAISFYKKKLIYREDGRLYLIRRTLFTCSWFSIKIHNILLSDYACLHDHPWLFLTFILKGSYVEWIENKKNPAWNYSWPYLRNRFSILYRAAKFKHRLEITDPVWSFVITFKKTREWGFWPKEGFIPWFKYNDNGRCE